MDMYGHIWTALDQHDDLDRLAPGSHGVFLSFHEFS